MMFEYHMRMRVGYRSDKHVRLHEGRFDSPEEMAFVIAQWMYEDKYGAGLVPLREPPEVIAWILEGVVCHRLEGFILPGIKELWQYRECE